MADYDWGPPPEPFPYDRPSLEEILEKLGKTQYGKVYERMFREAVVEAIRNLEDSVRELGG